MYEKCREAVKSGDTSVAAVPEPSEIEFLLGFLKEGEELCDDIGLRECGAKLSLTHTHIKHNPGTVDWSSLYSDCRNIGDVIMSEFWNRTFVQVSPECRAYVNAPALFGDAVNTAFPSAREDIKQAGNCLAVECGTATVFHLMRAVEWGLRALCRDLKLIRVRKSKTAKKYIPIAWAEWERLLTEAQDRVDKKIAAMSPGKLKQDAQEFYYPALREIRAFKNEFRIHVMHTRAEYTPEDARAVLDHVQRFMVLLSSKVSE